MVLHVSDRREMKLNIHNEKGVSLLAALFFVGVAAVVIMSIAIPIREMGRNSARSKTVISTANLQQRIQALLGTKDLCTAALLPAGVFSYAPPTTTINFTKIILPSAPNPIASKTVGSLGNLVFANLSIANISWTIDNVLSPPISVATGGKNLRSYSGTLELDFNVLNYGANNDGNTFVGGNLNSLKFPLTLVTDPAAGGLVSYCYFNFSPQEVCAHTGGTFDPVTGNCNGTLYDNAYTCNPTSCPAGILYVSGYDSEGKPYCICRARGT
jgi:hypothetical protein